MVLELLICVVEIFVGCNWCFWGLWLWVCGCFVCCWEKKKKKNLKNELNQRKEDGFVVTLGLPWELAGGMVGLSREVSCWFKFGWERNSSTVGSTNLNPMNPDHLLDSATQTSSSACGPRPWVSLLKPWKLEPKILGRLKTKRARTKPSVLWIYKGTQ